MNVKDIQLQSYVHHRIFFNWGRGVVIKRRDKDNLGYKTAARFFVKWESDGKATWCRASDLRKTPRSIDHFPQAVKDKIAENAAKKTGRGSWGFPPQEMYPGEFREINNEPFHPNEFDGPSD